MLLPHRKFNSTLRKGFKFHKKLDIICTFKTPLKRPYEEPLTVEVRIRKSKENNFFLQNADWLQKRFKKRILGNDYYIWVQKNNYRCKTKCS